jgi:hypothetical protein
MDSLIGVMVKMFFSNVPNLGFDPRSSPTEGCTLVFPFTHSPINTEH